MPPRIPLSGFSHTCRIPPAPTPTASSVPSSLPLLLLARLSIATSSPPPPPRLPQKKTPRTGRDLVGAQLRQARHASVLHGLRSNPGATKKRTRVGRGPSSGHGKTSGRGHKGSGQRGSVNPWFQGGQTPLIVSRGQKGFENIRAPVMAEVNVDSIQAWINLGRLNPLKPITPKELIESRLARLKDGIKLLGRNANALQQPIDIVVSRASQSAIKAVEDAGGRIITRYYTRDSMRRLLCGESANSVEPLPVGEQHVPAALAATRAEDGRRLYRLPDPTGRWDIEYYRDPKHRGYMSGSLTVGESPSLFYRVPAEIDDVTLAKATKARLAKLSAKKKDQTYEERLF